MKRRRLVRLLKVELNFRPARRQRRRRAKAPWSTATQAWLYSGGDRQDRAGGRWLDAIGTGAIWDRRRWRACRHGWPVTIETDGHALHRSLRKRFQDHSQRTALILQAILALVGVAALRRIDAQSRMRVR
jgi:mannose/cellobiose epimerase-like protein (N-acyl-D-glucosamine 2-epimerase family)